MTYLEESFRPDRPLEIVPDAVAELRDAARFYDDRAPGLADGFITEVEHAFQAITDQPKFGSPMKGGRRRLLLRRFPYAVIYREMIDGRVRVLAIAHLRRRPGYWRAREIG